jgi:diguanylate cyclase (GGDEF)-like protein
MGTAAASDKPVVLIVGDDQRFEKIASVFRDVGNTVKLAETLDTMIYEIHEDEKANLALLVDCKLERIFAALSYLGNIAHRSMAYLVVGEDEFGGFQSEQHDLADPLPWKEQWGRIHSWALNSGAYDAFLKEKLLHKDKFDLENLIRRVNFSPAWKRLAEVVKDHLTGLLNARGFERTVIPLIESMRDRRQYERHPSEGDERDRRHHHYTVFSILMGDADKFKDINDRYGHLVGDEAIIMMANTLSGRMRPADILARRSGDEFMLCLPGFTLEQAESTALELQQTLSAAEFYGREGERVHLNMSFGAASIQWYEVGPAADKTLEKVIERADLRLIAKKKRPGS